ncbi:MAG: hypothetical protein RLZ28_1321, partial [Actinomycetota bacterium]
MRRRLKRIAPVPRAAALLFALFFGTAGLITASSLARADDIEIVASVVESSPSPTSTPTEFVKLPLGQDTETAPIVTGRITDLDPYSFVQVFVQSEPILIASGFADKFGVFTFKAPLPTTLEAGRHEITASTQERGETTASVKALIAFSVLE